MPDVLGLDIGGANLKAATSDGFAVTLPFALWKQPEKLAGGLIDLLLRFPPTGPVAVTMTGELCDCFENKTAGVRHILTAIREAAGERPVYVWRNDGKWASVEHAMEDPLPVAAANWLAAATFAGRFLEEGLGWYLDLGSTTFDVVPLVDGLPIPLGRNDLTRLKAGELAYLGVGRTPVCAVVQTVDVDGVRLGVASELFATVQDAFVVCGAIKEDAEDASTADGRARTRPNALRRLARTLCSDLEELGEPAVVEMAEQIMTAFRKRIISRLEGTRPGKTPGAPDVGVILAGSGEFLLADILNRFGNENRPMISLAGKLGPRVSTALPAHAVAVLLSERLQR
jgi:(4-(4-[2-(gamma-L-glutamylamino)ethyl]phenoxymethyl)furan-2-yl)methanamine synthase